MQIFPGERGTPLTVNVPCGYVKGPDNSTGSGAMIFIPPKVRKAKETA